MLCFPNVIGVSLDDYSGFYFITCDTILLSGLFCYHLCLMKCSVYLIGQFECICILVLGVGSIQPDTS